MQLARLKGWVCLEGAIFQTSGDGRLDYVIIQPRATGQKQKSPQNELRKRGAEIKREILVDSFVVST